MELSKENVDIFLRLIEEALLADEMNILPSSISDERLIDVREDIVYLRSKEYFDDINSRRSHEEKKASEEQCRSKLKEMKFD